MRRYTSHTDLLALIVASREVSSREMIVRACLVADYAMTYTGQAERKALRASLKGDALAAVSAIYSAVDAGVGNDNREREIFVAMLLKGKVPLHTIRNNMSHEDAIATESAESANETLPA